MKVEVPMKPVHDPAKAVFDRGLPISILPICP